MATGLSDRAQTVLVILSYVLGSLGSATTVLSLIQQQSPIAGIIILSLGAISVGIKESLGALGFKPASSSTSTSTN